MADERKKRVKAAVAVLQLQRLKLASMIATTMYSNNAEMLLKQKRDFVPRIEHYYDQIIPLYSLDDFKSHFRLTRDSFQSLLLQVGNSPTYNQARGRLVNVEKEMLMFLWYLGM